MPVDKEIILVDGTALIFRAYYANIRNPLATSDGRGTQAIFGMLNTLRKLKKEHQPTHIAIIMDARGKTFRHELYPDYKANRDKMPDDLRQQIATIRQIIPALGLPLLSVDGVEADDVIGTLCKRATTSGFNTVIISNDKDFAQLVDDRVELLVDTMKNIRFDTSAVKAKFGVPPERFAEYLAVVGDSSDNIPGLPLVGPKTAIKWFQTFETLDNIIQHLVDTTKNIRFDASAVKDKFEVPPERIAEYLAVIGYSSDNTPGIPLVGPKTAIKWFQIFETLDDIIQHVELSRQLTTIKCDVELEDSPENLVIGKPDNTLLRRFYEDLEFRSWSKEITEPETSDSPTEDQLQYETILDQKTLDKWLGILDRAPLFALDTETTSTDAHQARLVGLSFCAEPGHAAYLPLGHDYPGAPAQLPWRQTLERLRPLLENPARAKTGQNLKYDIEVLQRHGIDPQGVTDDTMLMSYVLQAGHARHDLDSLAKRHLGWDTIKFSEVAGKGRKQLTFNQVDVEPATRYAAEDADVALRLHRVLTQELAKNQKLSNVYRDIEMPLLQALVRTENHGVKIDGDRLRQQGEEIGKRLGELERQAHALAGQVFSIASPRQIQEILYDQLGLPVLKKTPKGQPSTAENVLQELAENYPLPALILEHRGLAKLKGTYIDRLPELINPHSGRIHTSYHQAVASTGRLSSSDPNLQNIPVRSEQGRKIREAFIPEPGYMLVAADYSQIELRIMAHLSADPGLIEAFNHGVDIHRATAAEVFGVPPVKADNEQRTKAKAINFGLIYGISAYGLARQLKITPQQAKRYMDIYFERYPGVEKYMQDTRQRAREQGFVETLFGRRLNLPEINSKNGAQRQYAERIAINAPVQGTAADLIKMAMLALDRWLIENDSCSKIILQVHDELVFEVPEDQVDQMVEIATDLMCGVTKLKIPLIVDIGIGHNWKEAH